MDLIVHKLAEEFVGIGSEVRDFKFKQLKALDNHYIYEVDSDDGDIHYEVFTAKKTPICIDFKERIYSETDVKEHYPKGKDFGYSAFTMMTLKDAKSKIKELIKLELIRIKLKIT